MDLPAHLPLPPFTRPVHGTIRVPGSKSMTNRALILAALAEGTVTLEGALFSRDSRLLMDALQALGFAVEAEETAARITVIGQGGRIPLSAATLEVGNSGTTARFLAALVALHPAGNYVLQGDDAMHERPFAGLFDALRQQGVRVTALATEGCLPARLETSGLPGGEVTFDASASSQYVTALLLAGSAAQSALTVHAPGVRPAFVELTCAQMDQWDLSATREGPETFRITPGKPQPQDGQTYAVEPDLSAASYYTALPLAVGGEILLVDLPTVPLQGDKAFADVVAARSLSVDKTEAGWRVAAAAWQASAPDDSIDEIDFNLFSDTFLTLAALAPLRDRPTCFTGIAHTRHQETDRIAAMATELRKLGVGVEETEGSLTITPDPVALKKAAETGVVIDTYEDHRIAMSFALLGSADLRGNGQAWMTINDSACCGKTFPRFFHELARLRHPEGFILALDGVAGAGKSTTGRAVAKVLNCLHVDTGSHYRAVAIAAHDQGLTPEEGPALDAFLAKLELNTIFEGQDALVTIDGRVPTAQELAGADAIASPFAALPSVRSAVKAFQQSLAAKAREAGLHGLVMGGRDIGTVIYPHAALKIYLTASPDARAQRREQEGRSSADMAARDKRDATRKTAPLQRAADAIEIDNTDMSFDQVVAEVLRLARATLLVT